MALPLLMMALQAGSSIMNAGTSLYNSNMGARALLRQAKADAEQVLEAGRQTVQSQRLISSGSGFINTGETSTYKLMLDTQEEAKRQADRIMYLAKKQAKSMKKGGILGAVGGIIGGGSSIFSNFK